MPDAMTDKSELDASQKASLVRFARSFGTRDDLWTRIQSLEAQLAAAQAENEALRDKIINTPETADFMAGVPLEATHQRERWGADHDKGKTPWDWFWLIGYLSQKAASAAVAGDTEKAMHHAISTAAALANWHAALSGVDTRMVPGAPLPIQRQADEGETQ